jgi:hypothetical protein
LADCGTPVEDSLDGAAGRNAGHDFVDDDRRILGPGVVGRHVGHVGSACGDVAHQGTFRPVAIAAAAEHRDEVTPGGDEVAGRAECGIKRGRCVCVIDQHGEVLAGIDPFHPPRNDGRLFEPGHDRIEFESGDQCRGCGGERIHDIERSDQRHADRYRFPAARGKFEPDAVR